MLKTLAKEIKTFKKASILTPICMFFEVVFEMLIPLLMASIVDKGIANGDMVHIYKIGALMVLAAAGGMLSGLLGAKFGARASTGFARNLRRSMFANIQTYSFENIDKFSTAGLITRMTTDVTNLQNAFQMILRMCTRAPSSIIIAMVMTFIISPRLASIYLIAVIVLGFALFMIMKRTTKYFQTAFEKYDQLNSGVQENISGIRVVKSFVREEYETRHFQDKTGALYALFVRAEKILTCNNPLMQCTVYTCILLISWIGAHMIVSSSLTTGELMSMLTYCMNILMSLMMLSMVFVMITMSLASAKRIAAVLDEQATITNPQNPLYAVPDGSIVFSHVSFAYNKQSAKPVLQDINLSIQSGETIGIIGSTGSAKSSLVNLISRLYDVTDGSITVGGHDVREYNIETLRNAVSVVLQKNVLFSGTVLENLRWGNADATYADCKRACTLACADDFVSALPNGYDTMVERGGTNFSGGQKQRLCIARALLKNPKILILDDSTSAVDTATDARIRKAFREEIPDVTKLIISQRVSSIQHADRILVLEDGRINGFDTHDNLLKTNAIYEEIYRSQTAGDGDFDEKGGES